MSGLVIAQLGAEVCAAVIDIVGAAMRESEPPSADELLSRIASALIEHRAGWIESAKTRSDALFAATVKG